MIATETSMHAVWIQASVTSVLGDRATFELGEYARGLGHLADHKHKLV